MILLDGTMSTLAHGDETNIGLIYKLLSDLPRTARVNLYYEPGIQWRGIRRSVEVIAGVGINRQIKRAYLFLARNYRPGDRIYLMGFSRGAYAVRSLAGLIDEMGLLQASQISHDTLERVYVHYRTNPGSPAARALAATLCHTDVPITFMGVFDTVRALGIRWPLIWQYLPPAHPFHSHELGPQVERARHALALNETRLAYAPVMWTVPAARAGPVQQMWFRGNHGDVGGQIGGHAATRPLSNIPLVWMLAEVEAAGLPLPALWRQRYVTNAAAPSCGTFAGWGKIFILRQRRVVGADPSECVHPSAREAASALGLRLPVAAPRPVTVRAAVPPSQA